MSSPPRRPGAAEAPARLPAGRRVPIWAWSIPVVWIISAPVGFTLEPQWDRVNLVPFADPADKITDLALNLLLFVPFGYSFAHWPGGTLRLIAAAAATSASAECLQLFSTIRHPSSTDVVYAVAGALGGAALRRFAGLLQSA